MIICYLLSMNNRDIEVYMMWRVILSLLQLRSFEI